MKSEFIFGEVLRELRKKCKLSEEKLAQECDLDRTFISLLESLGSGTAFGWQLKKLEEVIAK